MAYISTTKRQDSTLQLFLDLCAESGLIVEEVAREGGAVAFQELPALHHGQGTLGRRQYVLHRVTSQGCSTVAHNCCYSLGWQMLIGLL